MSQRKDLFVSGEPNIHQNFPIPPSPKTKKFKRVHRIILDSRDMFEGEAYNGKFAVNLPSDVKAQDCQLFVESFVINDTTNTSLCDSDYFHIHLHELFQPLLYYSGTKGPTDIIATIKGRQYYTLPTFESCGIPLTDPSFFNNKVFTVRITSPNFVVANVIDTDWVLTLAIYEETEK